MRRIGAPEKGRAQRADEVVEIHPIKDIESLEAQIELRLGRVLSQDEFLFYAQVDVEISGAAPGVSPDSGRPVVGDRVMIVVRTVSDVERSAGPYIDDSAQLDFPRKLVRSREVKLVAPIEIGQPAFPAQIIVVGRKREEPSRVVGRPRKRVLPDIIEVFPRAASEHGAQAVAPGRSRRLKLVHVDETRVRPKPILQRRIFSLSFGLRYELQSNLNDSNNLGPRLAFAYSPGGGRTAVRAGAGVFYDRQPESVRQQSLLYDGLRIRQVVVSNPGYPDPFESEADPRLATPSIVRIAHDIRNPYVIQGGVAVDRQTGKRSEFPHARRRGRDARRRTPPSWKT